MKHRCLSGFLALVMLVCTLYSDVCIADEIEDNITLLQNTSTTLTADNIEISGDTAKVNFAVSDNPGICFLDVKIEYDKTVFSLNEEAGCTAGDLFSSGSIEVKENDSGSEIIWYSVKDIDKDGVIFSLTFDVREGTVAACYPIGVKLVQKNTINSKEEMVPVNCVSGSITIRNFSPLFIAEQTEIKCTGEFEYGISIQDNPGIAGFGVLISYDTNYLTLICESDDSPEIKRTEAFNNGIMIATATESGVRVLWSANSNNNSEGQIFSLRFEPKAGAIGPSNISISVENENTLNENETEISFETKSGKVVVKHDILLIPAKTPNCIEPGNISYWKCKDCEALPE